MLFSVINISCVSLTCILNKNIFKRTKNSPENQQKIQICILQLVRYSTVEDNFIIKCDVCIVKIPKFMSDGF